MAITLINARYLVTSHVATEFIIKLYSVHGLKSSYSICCDCYAYADGPLASRASGHITYNTRIANYTYIILIDYRELK